MTDIKTHLDASTYYTKLHRDKELAKWAFVGE
jgi:hypothetical protein